MIEIDLTTIASVKHMLAIFILACGCLSALCIGIGLCKEADERRGE